MKASRDGRSSGISLRKGSLARGLENGNLYAPEAKGGDPITGGVPQILLTRQTVYDGPIQSDQLQSVHRAFASAELIGLDAKALEHRCEEPREWVVVLGVEGEVLTVLEAAASE